MCYYIISSHIISYHIVLYHIILCIRPWSCHNFTHYVDTRDMNEDSKRMSFTWHKLRCQHLMLRVQPSGFDLRVTQATSTYTMFAQCLEMPLFYKFYIIFTQFTSSQTGPNYLTRGFPFFVFAVSLSAHPSHQRHGAICLQSHWPPSCHRGWNVPKSPSHRACVWPPGESTALRTGRKSSKKFQKLALERVSKEYPSNFSITMYPWRHSNCGMKHLQHQRTACHRKMVKLPETSRNLQKLASRPESRSKIRRNLGDLASDWTGVTWASRSAWKCHGHDHHDRAMVMPW